MIFITKPEDRGGSYINELFLIMKLIIFLVSFNINMDSDDSFAQTITLQVKNSSLVEAMRSIQKQSGHSYFLNGKELANIRVNADIEDLDLSEAMSVLLKDKAADWVLEDGTIVIRPSIIEQLDIKTERKVKEIKIAEQQQRRTITGTVVDDADDSPLIGASITVEGTGTGVITDDKGHFSIEISEEGAALEFSYIGYKDETVFITDQGVVDIRMISDDQLE